MRCVELIFAGVTTPLGWDGADRNINAATTGSPTQTATIAYTRDADNQIVRRDATVGDPVTTVLHSYTGSGDTADLALDGNKRVRSMSLSLPGGALLTLQQNYHVVPW